MKIDILPQNVPHSNRLTMVQGNDVNLHVTVDCECADQEDLSQKDITGYTVWFTLKRYITDADINAIIQKISPATPLIIDAEMGLIRIPIASTDTINLPNWYQNYYFDVQLKDVAGKIVTSGMGTLGIYPGITNVKS